MSAVQSLAQSLEGLDAADRALTAACHSRSGEPLDPDQLYALIERRRSLAAELGLTMLEQHRLDARAATEPAPLDAEKVQSWCESAATKPIGAHGFGTCTGDLVVLSELMDLIGPPDPQRDLDALRVALAAENVARWKDLRPPRLQQWVEHLIARARDRQPPWAFKAFRDWSATHHPGHLHGLAKAHEPMSGSWHEDAEMLWANLEGAFSDLPGGRRSTATRPRAAREALAEDAPLDLPRLAALGKAIAIIGGEADRTKLERLAKRTALELEWLGCEDGERLAVRVRSGRVGAVIVLDRLGGHSALAPVMEATRSHGVPLQYGRKGGLVAISEALRQLEARVAGTG